MSCLTGLYHQKEVGSLLPQLANTVRRHLMLLLLASFDDITASVTVSIKFLQSKSGIQVFSLLTQQVVEQTEQIFH